MQCALHKKAAMYCTWTEKNGLGKKLLLAGKQSGRAEIFSVPSSLTSLNNTNHVKIIIYVSDKRQNIAKIAKNCKVAEL